MTGQTFIDRLAAILGPQGLVADPREAEPYITDWRGYFRGATAAVALPASTDQVVGVVRLCAETGTAIVPQGGNTGMCGGATPSADGTQIVLNLKRMNRVLEVDALNNTITVQAGCVLASIQQAAAAVDRLFPLSLGAEGSCQIGGNLSTNAGGVNVLRYGNARDLALGLEVVLPDGRVWTGLRGLRKDNTGYDLKQVFIGSEGTLGVITAAVLKLFPRPRAQLTVLFAVPEPAAAVALLARLRAACGERITAFELMSRPCLELVLRHIPGTREPLPQPHPWYALAELTDTATTTSLRDDFERALSAPGDQGLPLDAVVAESTAQVQSLWRMRETIPEASRSEGPLCRHDISLPTSRLPEFIAAAGAAVEQAFPGARIICFGHLGDGNLHYNVFVPPGAGDAAAVETGTAINRTVHDIVLRHGGSFSAEHGIGQSKRGELLRYKSAVELDLMRMLKRTFDPNNIMNPGKVLPD